MRHPGGEVQTELFQLGSGTCAVVTLTFHVSGSGATAISVTGDSPVAREVADVNANVLVARFNQFLGGGQPQMGFQRLGGQLRMRWPLAASSYILQSTTNLLAPVWVDETNSLNLNGSDLETEVPVGNQVRFFRLRKP